MGLMILTEDIVKATKRMRGELGLSITALGHQIGLTNQTLDRIFLKGHRKVTPATYRKLSDWLIKQYLQDDIKWCKQVISNETKKASHGND